MFEFAQPYAFFLVVPLAVAAWYVYRRRVRHGIVFAATGRIPAHGTTWRAAASVVLPLLYLAGLLLGIIALARPRNAFSRIRDTSEAIAIEMAVDISESMEALDLSERTATGIRYRTRLDVVKDTFAEFVGRRPGDLIGLVTFGGYAVTRAPLTTDKDALKHVLQGIEIPKGAFDREGNIINREELMTAIGDALALSCSRLRDVDVASKIVVLLSDGESNTGVVEPEEAVRIAKELGIKVYTIGIGSQGLAPFRARDVFGREVIQRARVSFDEKTLRHIAESTGGQYFNVRDPEGLEEAMAHIDKLEKTEIQRDIYLRYDELFPRFLLPGLACVLIAAALNLATSRRIV